MVQKSKQTESKTVANGGKENENETEKPTLVSSEVIRKEVQEESVKPEEDTVKTEVGMAEPASGKDGEVHSDEGATEGQKQGETKVVGEK